MTALPTTLPAPAPRVQRARRAAPWVAPLVAAAGVLVFWWGATGVLLALQRSAHTRLVALAVAVAAGAGGLALTAGVRRARAGAGAAAGGVLAGALLWTAVSAAFYGGWVVGPDLATTGGAPHVPGATPSLARAAAAVAATAFSTFLSLALLGLALRAAATPRGTARPIGTAAGFAPLTFGVLWAAHELAKLNVFFGVANPGAELLPAYLAPLRAYFGPPHNSALLAPSVAALAAAALVAARAAARARDPARRAGCALVAGVLALAALEHALLGTRAPVGWWDVFLRWRGAP